MLEGIKLTDFAPASLLGVAILLILLGRLVPRSTYQEKKEESERWREAYETERDARQVSELQTIELLELAKTTHKLIAAIVKTSNVDVPQESGGSDVG